MRSRPVLWSSALAGACALTAATLPLRVHAGTMTGGASEWTQVMNNVALLQQIVHAIRAVIQLKRQVEYMGKQVADFGSGSPNNARAILYGFQSVLGQTQAILFAGQSLKTQWELTHPGRVSPDQRGLTDAEAYRRIDQSVQASVVKTLCVLDVQSETDERRIFESLQVKMESASGQLQAQKAGNELLLEIIRQLMALRAVVAAHANMMGEFVGADAQRRQYEDAIRERERYQGKYRSLHPIDWAAR